MTITLSSVEEALQYVADIDSGIEVEEVEFAGELAAMCINVKGEKYHSTIPSELARGLWEYQEAIYKAAAFVMFGADDIRRLPSATKAELELVFEVSEGSSALLAPLKDLFVAIGDGIKTMDDRHKVKTIILIAVILAGGVVAWKALDDSGIAKKEEIKATLALRTEEEKTKQFEIIARASAAQPAVRQFEKAAEEGTKAVVRGASDAESIGIGRAKFSRDDIKEANQRSARTGSTATVIEGDYRVFGTESRHGDSTRYVLAGADGVEFPVTVSHGDLGADDLEKLWAAARSRTAIKLEVSITKNRGQIRAAQIIAVL